MTSRPLAVLWDADGVLQRTAPDAWDMAVEVVGEFADAMTTAEVDEPRIRAAAHDRGLDDRIDHILAVWSSFDPLDASLEVLAKVRAAGTPCYLATNQDAYRAACMRAQAGYDGLLDGEYYSCELGVAKPSVAFFERVAADIGVAPEDLLFIDDRADNVAGARAAGLAAERWKHDEGTSRLRDILASYGVPVG